MLRAGLVWGAQLGIVLAMVGWAAPAAHRYVTGHPYFALRDIQIERPVRIGEDTIRAQTGLSLGMSIWDVDVEAIGARLRDLAWVRSVRVRRWLPNRVEIHVTEHRPSAIVHVTDAAAPLYYLADSGHVFAAVGGHDGRDLPYVSGLGKEDLVAETGFGPDAIRAALDVLRLARQHREGIGVVSEVHVDPDVGITILPIAPAIPIELGWGEYGSKLARVARVLPHWAGRDDEVRYVNGVFDDAVVVQLRVVPREWGA